MYAAPWEIVWVLIACGGFFGNLWCYRIAVSDRKTVIRVMASPPVEDPLFRQTKVSNLLLANGILAQERLRLVQQAFFLTVGVGACFLPPSTPEANFSQGQVFLLGLVRLSFFVPVVLASMASWMRLRLRRQLDDADVFQ